MMSEVMVDVLGPDRPLAYLSGPSFAMEIAQGLATAVTVASTDRDLGYHTMPMLTLTLTLSLSLSLSLTLALTLSLPLPLPLTLSLTLIPNPNPNPNQVRHHVDAQDAPLPRPVHQRRHRRRGVPPPLHLPYISLISPLYGVEVRGALKITLPLPLPLPLMWSRCAAPSRTSSPSPRACATG